MSDRILVAREYGMQSYTVDVTVIVWVVVVVSVNMVMLFVRDMIIPMAMMVASAMSVTSLNRFNCLYGGRETNKLIRPWYDRLCGMSWNVVVVLEKGDGEKKIWKYKDINIVTNEGDKYYAQRAAGETPTNNFNTMYLGNGTQPTWTKTSNYGTLAGAISGSAKTVASGYPKTNDTDPDNTGGGVDVVTWKFSWAKADFSATGINQAVISVASASSSSPILTGFNMTAFDKTSNDTLTIFVNHSFEGV
jgi:hypothetical protein